MLRQLLTSLRVLLIPAAFLVHPLILNAANAEDTLAKINRLGQTERQAAFGARSQERAQRRLVRADESRGFAPIHQRV
jgi:hypothetical protein